MKPTKKGNVICIACNSCVLYESCIYDVYIYIIFCYIMLFYVMSYHSIFYYINYIISYCLVFYYNLLYIEMCATHTTYTSLHQFIHSAAKALMFQALQRSLDVDAKRVSMLSKLLETSAIM